MSVDGRQANESAQVADIYREVHSDARRPPVPNDEKGSIANRTHAEPTNDGIEIRSVWDFVSSLLDVVVGVAGDPVVAGRGSI